MEKLHLIHCWKHLFSLDWQLVATVQFIIVFTAILLIITKADYGWKLMLYEVTCLQPGADDWMRDYIKAGSISEVSYEQRNFVGKSIGIHLIFFFSPSLWNSLHFRLQCRFIYLKYILKLSDVIVYSQPHPLDGSFLILSAGCMLVHFHFNACCVPCARYSLLPLRKCNRWS